MRRTFSTDHFPLAHRFRNCREMNRELFGRSDMRQLVDEPFVTHVGSVEAGALALHHIETSAVENRIAQSDRAGKDRSDVLIVSLLKAGAIGNDHLGNVVALGPGDMSIADNRFARTCRYAAPCDLLAVVVPRDHVERAIGPAQNFAGLRIGRRAPTAALTRNFLLHFARLADRLTPERAARMSAVAIDMLVGTVAERIAREPPRTVAGTLVVRRAEAFVQANLADPALDPPGLALAVGVSLRRLQQLFRERGHSVSGWIWERRLAHAAARLADPAAFARPIGTVAAEAGFVTQAHFARRFRDRFGLSPSDYRHVALSRPDRPGRTGSAAG